MKTNIRNINSIVGNLIETIKSKNDPLWIHFVKFPFDLKFRNNGNFVYLSKPTFDDIQKLVIKKKLPKNGILIIENYSDKDVRVPGLLREIFDRKLLISDSKKDYIWEGKLHIITTSKKPLDYCNDYAITLY